MPTSFRRCRSVPWTRSARNCCCAWWTGLEPASLQWLSGFAAGVAYERAAGRAGGVAAAGRAVTAVGAPCDRLRLANRQRQAHRRAPRAQRRGRWHCGAGLCRRQLSAEGPRQGAAAGRGRSARMATATRRTTRAASSSSSLRVAPRSSSSCPMPCSRSAIRAIRASAKPAARSMSAWRRSVRSGSSIASSATWITKSLPRRGSTRS